MQLLLASSSPYRRQLLSQLKLPFVYAAPDIDESPNASETPEHYVERLAIAKRKRCACATLRTGLLAAINAAA